MEYVVCHMYVMCQAYTQQLYLSKTKSLKQNNMRPLSWTYSIVCTSLENVDFLQEHVASLNSLFA